MTVELLNLDCMEYMADCEQNAFDLAIVDPPYSWNSGNAFTARLKKYGDLGFNDSRPPAEYFAELRRVSEHQIIWGGNYFLSDLVDTKCMIFWHKHQPVKTYADGEIAWASFPDQHVEYIDLPYFGAHGRDTDRIHPNQKPVLLYELLLNRYATQDSRILDTHLGSASSAIAAHRFGCSFVGTEVDPVYYEAARNRFQHESSQASLFHTSEPENNQQDQQQGLEL